MCYDYLPGGSLQSHLKKKVTFTENETSICNKNSTYYLECILVCVLLALEYLHDHDIIHGNVQPQNILFNDKGLAFLSDFKHAKRIKPSEVYCFQD